MMGSLAADAKQELKKLQRIAEYTEEWACTVASFLVVTQDLCKSAAHVLCLIDDDAYELEAVLVDGAETVANAVCRVVELAREKSTEVVNEFQSKGGACKKGSDLSLKDVQVKVEQASLAVGLAIFETLQLQADEFGKLADKSITAAKSNIRRFGSRLPMSPSARHIAATNSNGRLKCNTQPFASKSEASAADDIDLDWEEFEQNLQAMTTAIEGDMNTAEVAIRRMEEVEAAREEDKRVDG